jgi:hypothetical protein
VNKQFFKSLNQDYLIDTSPATYRHRKLSENAYEKERCIYEHDESIALRTAFYLRSLTHKSLLLKQEHNSYIYLHIWFGNREFTFLRKVSFKNSITFGNGNGIVRRYLHL